MNDPKVGKVGTVDVRLAARDEERPRYERRYIPVTPASREIVGADTKVAAETTVAQWLIDDWSAGEGDLRWRDRRRYNVSDGAGPVSDGSGVKATAAVVQLNDTGGGTVMTDAKRIARATGRLVTGDDMAGKLYEYNDSTGEWDELWNIGGTGTDNVVSIAAVDDTSIFVTDSANVMRKVSSGSNSQHYASTTWAYSRMVSYQGQLYRLSNNDLYDVDTSTAETRTLVVDVGGTIDRNLVIDRRLITSDVGPIWIAPLNDGGTFIWEYNQADDVGYVVGEIPKDVQPYDLWFHAGIYFVVFRYAANHSMSGDAWLYYQVGGQRGVAGPFRSTTGVTASKELSIAGVIGDRLYIYFDSELWAYDLSAGGVSMAARGVAEPVSMVAYGDSVITATGTTSFKITPDVYDTGSGAELTTGRHDFGYIGLAKTLTTITVACESALATGETVGVAYSVDGGSYVSASGTMVATETTKTWTISTNASTVRGVEFELKVLPKAATSASSPKIVSITAEAVGSVSRLEWVMLVDVSDTNEQHGDTVVAGLKALKTAHSVVSFSDPWQVLSHVAAETFDVTVEEVNLPDIDPGADPVAVVRLRAVATV